MFGICPRCAHFKCSLKRFFFPKAQNCQTLEKGNGIYDRNQPGVQDLQVSYWDDTYKPTRVGRGYTLQIVCIFFVCEEANKTLNYLRLIANKANKLQRPIKIKIKASIKVPLALKRHFCQIPYIASQYYINIELFISTITYYNDTYNHTVTQACSNLRQSILLNMR